MEMVQTATERQIPAFADFAPPIRPRGELRQRITAAYRTPEEEAVRPLLEKATLPADAVARIRETARALIVALRAKHKGSGVEGGFCLLAQAYGDDNPLTSTLRAFRDETLASTAYGRWLIDVYYGTVGGLDLHGSIALRIVVGVLLLPLRERERRRPGHARPRRQRDQHDRADHGSAPTTTRS